jgi:hypothetical protein
VVVFDQVASTNPSFTKKWLLHSINQPAVQGNRFEIARTELAASLPYPDLWPQKFKNQLKYDTPDLKYQYDGKLYGWTVLPETATIDVVGGPGKEFYIEDPLNPGTGTNWNQCAQGWCPAGKGLGSVSGYVNPAPEVAQREPGSWRLEVKPSAPATEDLFLHVMLATNGVDTNVPVSVTVPANLPSGSVGATWTEGGKTYTVTFPQSGVGGHITIRAQVVLTKTCCCTRSDFARPGADCFRKRAKRRGRDRTGGPIVRGGERQRRQPLCRIACSIGGSFGAARVSMEMSKTNDQGVASTILTLGANTAGSVGK